MKKEKIEPVDASIEITPKIGAALIRESLSQIHEQRRQKVVSFVRSTIEQLDQWKKSLAFAQEHVDLHQGRLNAINAGKFTLTDNGDIVFDDSSLERQ
jgi:hypothetical protein